MTVGTIWNSYSDGAIASVLSNNRYVRFMPGDYTRTTSITGFQNGQKIEAKGAKFIAGSDTVTLFSFSGLTDVSIDELDMVGTRAGTGTVNTQHGISVSDCDNLKIHSITGRNFKGRAIMMPNYGGSYARRARNQFHNIGLFGNLMGLDIGGESANEYSLFTNINATGNAQVALIAAANTIINTGNMNDNVNGLELVGTASNYAHGIWSNLQVNHNTGFAVKITDNNYGQTIDNCHFYADNSTSNRIILQNSAKTYINGGVVSSNIEINAGANTRHGDHYINGANISGALYGVVGTNPSNLIINGYTVPSSNVALYTDGDTHTAAGTNTELVHNLKHTVPAGLLANGKVLRVTATWRLNTGNPVPSLETSLRLGGTKLIGHDSNGANASIVNSNFTSSYLITAKDAASASAPVEGAPVVYGQIGVSATYFRNNVAAPANRATNGALDIEMVSKWVGGAGSGTHTVKLVSLMVEEL